MLNLLKKTTPWMLASLFVATSLFGQDGGTSPKPCAPKCEPKCPPKPCPKPCPQPCPPTQICPADQSPCCPPWATPVLNAAYNYPARIRTRCPWDLDVSASFIYWQPIQENMELGLLNSTTAPSTNGYNASVINMDFNYKPGFQVNVGGYFDYDNWDLQLQYTWFHNTQKTSAAIDPTTTDLIYPMRGTPYQQGGANATFDSASASWKLDMDLVDLDLGRWHYLGTKLTIRPNFGVRAAWIGQKLDVGYVSSANTADTYSIDEKTRSWAVGLKTGFDTNWMLGCGFRMYTCGEADLLFTKYTRAEEKTSHTVNAANSRPVDVSQKQIYAVKPHVDLELGFGWGTYLDCNNWYLDMSAGYGFQVFFDQNMFRNFTDDNAVGMSTMPNGNLYLQGLTTKVSLAF